MEKTSSIILLAVLQLFALYGVSSADTCETCHQNTAAMVSLGHPEFAVSPPDSGPHQAARCTDCHLGDPKAEAKDDAHKGLLAAKLVDPKFSVKSRAELSQEDRNAWPLTQPKGANSATQLLPKKTVDGKLRDHTAYNLLIWQDKNPETLAFNPVIAEKTCGRCHGEIVKKFLKSPMGGGRGGHTQSQYLAWTGPSGPQSCGIWTGPLTQPGQDGFTKGNIDYFNLHSTKSISEKTAFKNQRTCNKCHVGCLDCHLEVRPQVGATDHRPSYAIVKRPSPLSCYGGGKAFVCHAGPLERRRGDGYMRGEFTQSSKKERIVLNSKPDVHMSNGVLCTDCHEPNSHNGGHADLKRSVSCGKCHPDAVKAHAKGPHKKVDCASCHTSLIGGYAFNFWTATDPDDPENPIKRIQDYLVGAIRPLIIKNPAGIWIPVHPVPHTSGNVKTVEVKSSNRLIFRNRPEAGVDRFYFSNDSYAVTGIVKNTDADKNTMVWINLDRVAHATGKSRKCGDCHDSSAQRIVVRFEGGSYKDLTDGEYVISADGTGLEISGFRDAETGAVPKDLQPFSEKWRLRGDFSLPRLKNRALYEKIEKARENGKFVH